MDRVVWGRDRLAEQQIKSAQQFDATDKTNEVLVNTLKQACSRNRALEKQELWAQKKKEDHGSATAVSLKSNAGEVRVTTRLPTGAEVTDNSTNKYEEERMRNSMSKEDVLLGRFCDGQDNAWRPDSFFSEEIGGDDIPPWPVRPTELFTNPHLCARIMHQRMLLKKQKKAEKKAAKEMDPSKKVIEKKKKKKDKKKGKKEKKKGKKEKKNKKDNKGKTSKKEKKDSEKKRKNEKTEKSCKKGRDRGFGSAALAGVGAPMAEAPVSAALSVTLSQSPGAPAPRATCQEPPGFSAQIKAAAPAQKVVTAVAQADGPEAGEAEAIESSSGSSSSSESDTDVEEGAPDWGD